MTEIALSLPPLPARPQPVVDMAEPARFASERRIVAADGGAGAITVAWDDGTSLRLHPLWLRSECACPACRDRVTLERTFDQFRLPEDLAAVRVEVTAAGALRLVWSEDGHESLFDPGLALPPGPRRGPGSDRPRHAAPLAGGRPRGRDPDLRPPRRHDRAAGAARLAHGAARRGPHAAHRRARGRARGRAHRAPHLAAARFQLRRGVRRDDDGERQQQRLHRDRAAAPRRPANPRVPAGFPVLPLSRQPGQGRRIRPTSTASRSPSTCARRSPRPSACSPRRRSASASSTRLPTTPGTLRRSSSTGAARCARSASSPG